MTKRKFNLRNVATIVVCLAVTTVFLGCDKDNPIENPAISVQDNGTLNQSIFADEISGKSGVTFTTTGAWTSSITETTATRAAIAPAWISIDPDHGDKAGGYTIQITLEPNTTGADRTATITITCGDFSITITVTQKAVTQSGEKLTVRLVSSITVYTYLASNSNDDNSGGSEWTETRTYAFQYDAQRRISAITTTHSADGSARTTSISYPNANAIVLSGSDFAGGSVTFPLNSDGSVASMNNGQTYTYANGYLQKIERLVKLQTETKITENGTIIEGEYHEGTGVMTYTWENGNIKVISENAIFPTAPSYNNSYTREYQYGSAQNKQCSIDLMQLFTGESVIPYGWYGKSAANLPAKVTETDARQFYPFVYDKTYRYETDSKGYVVKIFEREKEYGGVNYREERLHCAVSYQ